MYERDWLDDVANGQGKYFNVNGDSVNICAMTYVGTWLNGKRNGKGKAFDPNGIMTIEGDWLDVKLTGKGKSFFTNFGIDGQRNGNGKYFYMNGHAEYDGSWVDGQRNGKGKYFYGDRTFYDGYWKNNKRHGDGYTNDCLQYLNENDSFYYYTKFIISIELGPMIAYNLNGIEKEVHMRTYNTFTRLGLK